MLIVGVGIEDVELRCAGLRAKLVDAKEVIVIRCHQKLPGMFGFEVHIVIKDVVVLFKDAGRRPFPNTRRRWN